MGWKWHEMEPSLRMRFQKALNDEFEDHSKTSCSNHKRPVRNESLGSVQREKTDASRVIVRVTSYRTIFLDSDDPCPKYFVDGLRYAGLLHSDSFNSASISVFQEKAERKEDERTEIEIIYPD